MKKITVDIDKLAKEISETRKLIFKPKEWNEKNCFDLAVVRMAETIFDEETTKREFLVACDYRQ